MLFAHRAAIPDRFLPGAWLDAGKIRMARAGTEVANHVRSCAFTFLCFLCYFSFQCSDTVGWVTGRASGLQKAGCWFAGGDDLTGALHFLVVPVVNYHLRHP